MSKLQAAFSPAFGATLHPIGGGLATPEPAQAAQLARNRCHQMTLSILAVGDVRNNLALSQEEPVDHSVQEILGRFSAGNLLNRSISVIRSKHYESALYPRPGYLQKAHPQEKWPSLQIKMNDSGLYGVRFEEVSQAYALPQSALKFLARRYIVRLSNYNLQICRRA